MESNHAFPYVFCQGEKHILQEKLILILFLSYTPGSVLIILRLCERFFGRLAFKYVFDKYLHSSVLKICQLQFQAFFLHDSIPQI